MTFRLGVTGTVTRQISERANEAECVLSIVSIAAKKMQQASLRIFTQPASEYATEVKFPLSPDRVQQYIEESVEAYSPFFAEKERIGVVRKLIQEHFRHPVLISSSDLSCTSTDSQHASSPWTGQEDPRMQAWLAETIELTSHAIEVKNGTSFLSIPPSEQANCCFRYALEKIGVRNLPEIEDRHMLEKILLSAFAVVQEPQEGDLILFSRPGQLTHLGIQYRGNVLSKEGNASRVAYIRPIEDLCRDYGANVTYLRKKLG